MAANLVKVTRKGNDVIEVVGTVDGVVDGAGNLVTIIAQGWRSHMTNFYPPTSYNADGTLKAGSVPRAMTNLEKLAYWRQLLSDVAAPVTPPTPADQLFP